MPYFCLISGNGETCTYVLSSLVHSKHCARHLGAFIRYPIPN